MTDRFLEDLYNLETLIVRELPDSLERRDALKTIKEARLELIELWRKVDNSEPQPIVECPKCGGG